MTTRIEDYFTRVDAHLLELSEAERGAFLDNLIEQWESRYGNFRARVHRGAPTPPGLDAFDYATTIAGLESRKSNATRDALADLRKWQEARRQALKYNAGIAV